MVAIKIRETKCIVVFDENYKQFVCRETSLCREKYVARELRVERPSPQPLVLVTVEGTVEPYFNIAFVLLRRLV